MNDFANHVAIVSVNGQDACLLAEQDAIRDITEFGYSWVKTCHLYNVDSALKTLWYYRVYRDTVDRYIESINDCRH